MIARHLIPRLSLLLALSLGLGASAAAQSAVVGRASITVGLEGADGTRLAQGRFLEVGYRLGRAGPVAVEFSATRSQAHQWHRYPTVTTQEYCPGCPPPDTANAAVDWRAAVVLRLDRMPRFLSRLVPFWGGGTYHAPWLGLPARDAHRRPVWTGYQIGGVDLRVTRRPRLSFQLSVTQMRNVRDREDEVAPRLAVRWDIR